MPFDLYMESEYRKDSIDYSESDRYFYREKLSIIFSGESSLNAGYVFIEQEKEKRHTLSLVLNDISPEFSFLIGNYYINFGYGLLAGRKIAFERDPFSYRTGDETRGLFIPCKSGNPLYTFNGITASWNKKFYDISTSLNLFYSVNERFTDTGSYESGFIFSSLGTIDGKDDKAYNKSEPVDICSGGGLFSVNAIRLFTIQLFYIFTEVKSQNKKEIAWDAYDDYNAEYGTSAAFGGGFLLEYGDDFINIFCEGDMTNKELTENDRHKEDIRGYGLLYGFRFRPPFLKLSLTGKKIDGSFYSPYSSSIGEDYPEDAFFLDAEIKPFSNLKIGSSLSSQRKTSAGSMDDAIPATERQKIYIDYNYSILDELSVAARRVERSREEGPDKKYQLKESSAVRLFKILRIEASSIYQKSGTTGNSVLYAGGAGVSILSILRLSVNYASARISEGNNIYFYASPVQNSSSTGIMIHEDSDIIISKLDYKYKMIFFSCRYLYQYHDDLTLHRQFEFSASGKF
ncbi:MAG: hypothetical protein MUC95_06670 [Spirochaetes bacterium]|nr:hypothetical protein [Spirochaetota bacterium]